MITLGCALTGGCGDDKNETMSGTTSGDATSEATLGMSTAPTTGGTGGGTTAGSGVEGTGGQETGGPETGGQETGGPETGEPTTAGESGGTGGGGFGELCSSFCDRADECMAGLGPMCKKDCLDAFQGEEAACQAAAEGVFMCFAGLSCEELAQALEAGEDGACGPAIINQVEVCGGDQVCEVGGGGDMEGTACSWSVTCPEEPLLEMQCDMTTCMCLSGGDLVGECDAGGVCMDLAGLADKAAMCCGF